MRLSPPPSRSVATGLVLAVLAGFVGVFFMLLMLVLAFLMRAVIGGEHH